MMQNIKLFQCLLNQTFVEYINLNSFVFIWELNFSFRLFHDKYVIDIHKTIKNCNKSSVYE